MNKKYYFIFDCENKYFKKINIKNEDNYKTKINVVFSSRLALLLNFPVEKDKTNFKNIIFLCNFNPYKKSKGTFIINYKNENIPCWWRYFKSNNKYLIHLNKDLYYKIHPDKFY